MPRKLPWLEAAKEKKVNTEKARSSLAPNDGRDGSPGDLVDANLNSLRPQTPKKRERKPAARTPSTSPPPAPPDVEYMQEGFEADDIFMMVEDEFLSTAKTFTQHLHHAEYVRFKKLAKSRGADVLNAIQRPVDGKTAQSNGLRMQLEGNEKRQKIREAMSDGDEGSGDEDAYMRDPMLAGLMAGEKTVKRDLSGLTNKITNTRAAAGFSQSPRNVERFRDSEQSKDISHRTAADQLKVAGGKAQKLLKDEMYSGEEDDLDAPSSNPRRSMQGKVSERVFDNESANGPSPNSAKHRDRMFVVAESDPTRKPSDHSTRTQDRASSTSVKTLASNEVSKQRSKSDVTSDFLTRRKAERERKQREEKRKAKTSIEVPTFAI